MNIDACQARFRERSLRLPLLGRRRVLAWLGAGAAVAVLSACEAPKPPLRVGSIVFPGYELMFLARELGLLDEGQVRLVELLSNTDTLRALAAGQLEAAALTLDELMSARADGVDLKVIAILDVSRGADVVMARDSISLAALKGKRIGVEDGATGAVMLNALLEAGGLRLDQIHKVSMTLDRGEEFFKDGRVDVVVSAEPWAARMEKLGAHRLFDSSAMPNRIVDVLAARSDAIALYGPALKALVAAHFQALKYLQTHPGDANARMASRLQTPPAEVPAAFRGLVLPDARLNREMLQAGGVLHKTTLELQTVMVKAGLLRAVTSHGNLADVGLLPA